jgi:hypothetical protein
MRKTRGISTLASLVFSLLVLHGQEALAQQRTKTCTVTIHFLPGRPVNRFLPASSLGAAFDGHEAGETDRILRPQNIEAMLSAGLGPLTYRLRTELGNEVWHWNPQGSWSEGSRHQGYWASSPDTNGFISLSYGYRLPRRGNTCDQANNDGYSRIDDGDENSFWKSNPYLDRRYTGEAGHAQWVVIDLGKEEWINALCIHWGDPYALSYTVEYATKELYDYFDNAGYFETDSSRLWRPFPSGRISNRNGGSPVVKLSDSLVKARFLRIHMTESTHTAPLGSHDTRDSLGFAIKEIGAGRLDKHGVMTDIVRHVPDGQRQNKIYVSSTDPWHRATDIDSLTEQLGIDRLFSSGLTNRMPVLLSAGLLYDTPENALALVRYAMKRSYALAGVELGEEPDGQMIGPEDAAALYHQWAGSILGSFPETLLGGPSLQTIIPDQNGELFPTKKWMDRFLKYLNARDSSGVFRFFSFEWYPFDSVCAPAPPQLARAPAMLDKAMKDMKSIPGLEQIPFYITEYGYSAFSGISEVTLPGALMNADIVGQFLSLGGDKAFLYGLEPGTLQSDFGCRAGNNMLFGMDDKGKIAYRTATYFAARLLCGQWAQPSDSVLEVYPVTIDAINARVPSVSAYALYCPDSSWSLLLLNKDPVNAYKVNLKVEDEKAHTMSGLGFPLRSCQYSGKQYGWLSKGLEGHPLRSLPPEQKRIERPGDISLPPYSITVLRSW